MADIFKRVISEADQFRTKSDVGNASDPDISLGAGNDIGFYRKSDTEIAAVINNTDVLNIRQGIIILTDGGLLSSANNNSIFISGNSLQFRDGAGNTRRLD